MSKPKDENFWLTKLSESRFFTSKKDVELLRYLIHSTQEGKDLKETIVAIEFFGKDASFDPGSDSIVRSNIYNLRKKLESYYLDEGAADDMRFIIPKGQYQVTTKVSEKEGDKENNPTLRVKKHGLKLLFLLITLAMFLFAFLYFNSNKKAKNNQSTETSPIWSYYVESENTVLIVLGDYFMMQKTDYPDSTCSFVRNPDINNQTEFFNFLEKYPEQRTKLKKLGQSYFGEEIPKCFLQLVQILQNTGKSINAKYSSELSLTDIRENDLIFIGDYGTLNHLKPFFEKSNFRYSSVPQSVFILNNQNDTTGFYYLNNPVQSVFQNDYAAIASIESYPGKRILFFNSFLPFGKSEALYKLQEPTFISELTDTIDSFPKQWSLLMKISGLQSSGFYYEIINFSQ